MKFLFKFGLQIVIISIIGMIFTNNQLEEYIKGTNFLFDIKSKDNTYEIYYSGSYYLNIYPSDINQSHGVINVHGTEKKPANFNQLGNTTVFDPDFKNDMFMFGDNRNVVDLYLDDKIDNLIIYSKDNTGNSISINNINIEQLYTESGVRINNSKIESLDIATDYSVYVYDSNIENLKNVEKIGYGLNSTSNLYIEIDNSQVEDIALTARTTDLNISNSTIESCKNSYNNGITNISNSKFEKYEEQSLHSTIYVNDSKFEGFNSFNESADFIFYNTVFEDIDTKNTNGNLEFYNSKVLSDGSIIYDTGYIILGGKVDFISLTIDDIVYETPSTDEVLTIKVGSGSYQREE